MAFPCIFSNHGLISNSPLRTNNIPLSGFAFVCHIPHMLPPPAVIWDNCEVRIGQTLSSDRGIISFDFFSYFVFYSLEYIRIKHFFLLPNFVLFYRKAFKFDEVYCAKETINYSANHHGNYNIQKRILNINSLKYKIHALPEKAAGNCIFYIFTIFDDISRHKNLERADHSLRQNSSKNRT